VAEPGSILLVPAWHLYALRVLERVPDGSITLLLGASCLEGVGATERPALVTDGSLAAQMAALVAELRRPVRLLESGNGIRATLERLVARGMPLTVARPRRAVANLAPVREHLRAHLGEPVTTAELADLSGRTAWHLIRTFHREFGLPPHAYQMRLRVAAAGGLLSAGIGVSSAAYECGFADQSHLSRTFKEVYGLTPAAWAAAAARGPRHGAPADAPRPGAGSPPPATRIRHPLMIAARAARS
jgi:AraC-like DNA-binding protein